MTSVTVSKVDTVVGTTFHTVPVDARNNDDIKRIYDTVFTTRESLGYMLYTYSVFKSTGGQFVRMCISLGT